MLMHASILEVEHLVPPNRAGKTAPIRVVVGDAQSIVRYALRSLFAQEPDIELVGEAVDGRQVLDQARELQPDVLLLDFHMPHLDGLSVLKILQQSKQQIKSIMWTESEDRDKFVQAMRLGCSGIVPKCSVSNLITKSIRKVHGGEIWLDSCTTADVMGRFASAGEIASAAVVKPREEELTTRERQIVKLVSEGHKNKDMAELMFISEQTVKNHIHNIFGKLGVSDRLELAMYSISKGWHLVA